MSASPQPSTIFIIENQKLQLLNLIIGVRENNRKLSYKLIWMTTKVPSIHELAKSLERLKESSVLSVIMEAGKCSSLVLLEAREWYRERKYMIIQRSLSS